MKSTVCVGVWRRKKRKKKRSTQSKTKQSKKKKIRFRSQKKSPGANKDSHIAGIYTSEAANYKLTTSLSSRGFWRRLEQKNCIGEKNRKCENAELPEKTRCDWIFQLSDPAGGSLRPANLQRTWLQRPRPAVKITAGLAALCRQSKE